MAPAADFESLSRPQLVEEARALGVERPERMTKVELRDEMIRRTTPEEQQEEARGLFGVARSMLASVVETGLNLPDAAKVIRGDSSIEIPKGAQTPVATVTLAEIYAAQGHKTRALRMLDEVLADEPTHSEALRVKAELKGGSSSATASPAAASSVAAPTSSPLVASDASREAVTAEAPPVAPGETTDYVPGGYVDTTGEEIKTGKPPAVVEEEPTAVPPVVEEVASPSSVQADPPSEEPEPTSSESEPAPSEVAPTRPFPALGSLSPALVLAQSGAGLQLYWELPVAALERCGVDSEEGSAAIRLVGFKAHGTTPERLEKTVELDTSSGQESGKLNLEEFAEPLAVRAALGWTDEDAFLPLSVGRTIEEWGADRESQEIAGRAAAQLG